MLHYSYLPVTQENKNTMGLEKFRLIAPLILCCVTSYSIHFIRAVKMIKEMLTGALSLEFRPSFQRGVMGRRIHLFLRQKTAS